MKKGAINLFLVFGIVLLLSFSFVSANVFSDIWGKFTGKVIDAPSIGVKSASGYWTAWQNRDKPDGNGDLETISNAIQVYSDMCLHPTGIECQTADGKPASSTGQDISCDPTIGLTCFNLDNPGGCLDYRVRFYCGDITKSYNYSQSNSNFLINITSVNGGNPCYFGSSCKISWTYSTAPPANSLLKIEIFKSDGGFELAAQGVPVNGSSSNYYDLVLPSNPGVNQGSYFRVGLSVYNSQTAEVIASQQTNPFFVNISSNSNSGSSEPINPKLHWVDYYSGKELTSVSYPPGELIKAVAENTSIKYTDSSGNSVKRIITIHNKPEKGGLVNSLFSSAKKSSYVSVTTPDVWMSFNLGSSDVGQTYYFEIDGEPGISPGLTIMDGNKVSVCGNGIIEQGEQCDDGNNVTEGCQEGSNCTVCDSNCKFYNYPKNYSCFDTDGGINNLTKGTVYMWGEKYGEDHCSNSFNPDDAPVSQGKYLIEYFCAQNFPYYDFIYCNCLDGACVSNSYSQEFNSPSIENPSCSSGCLSDGKCVDIGYRKSGTYCNESGQFTAQYNADEICDNNFQCGSNLCISGKCVSQGLFDKILSWFKNIFG